MAEAQAAEERRELARRAAALAEAEAAAASAADKAAARAASLGQRERELQACQSVLRLSVSAAYSKKNFFTKRSVCE